ncbi:hypothetical protein CAEBREN_04857 [Caenorhabditis brenneri]|uniref:Uncharacterized protein n=1 Tax=Caenorhabditis brenneri TaxID=135651 RepID=G0NYP8_CAEBE|nr:hypothetical protein CAEBREN_04857 [Caenorhabditis brenneri]
MIMERLRDLIGSEWKVLGSRECATLGIGGGNELIFCLEYFDGTILIPEEEVEIEALRNEHADLTGEYTRRLRAEGFTYLEELKKDIEYPDGKDPEEYDYVSLIQR